MQYNNYYVYKILVPPTQFFSSHFRMKLTSLLLAGLATNGNAAVFDETEADYTVVVPAGAYHCYFQPMEKGYFVPNSEPPISSVSLIL